MLKKIGREGEIAVALERNEVPHWKNQLDSIGLEARGQNAQNLDIIQKNTSETTYDKSMQTSDLY